MSDVGETEEHKETFKHLLSEKNCGKTTVLIKKCFDTIETIYLVTVAEGKSLPQLWWKQLFARPGPFEQKHQSFKIWAKA